MRTRPEGIDDVDVARWVAAGWGVELAQISYAPLGFGSYHWHTTDGDGARWFVTVDDLEDLREDDAQPVDVPRRILRDALASARALQDAGLPFVVGPTPTHGGDVLHVVGAALAVSLYPHVEGEEHEWGAYPSRAERLGTLDHLVTLHGVAASVCPDVPPLALAIPRRTDLLDALEHLAGPWTGGPFSEQVRRLLTDHGADVREQLSRYDALTSVVLGQRERMVLTHGEPHRGNTITTASGVVLIDWDTLRLAVPERDLWSLVDEDPEVRGVYESRTGVALDPHALDLFRVAWDLTEVALFAAELRAPHEEDEDTAVALRSLEESCGRLSAARA